MIVYYQFYYAVVTGVYSHIKIAITFQLPVCNKFVLSVIQYMVFMLFVFEHSWVHNCSIFLNGSVDVSEQAYLCLQLWALRYIHMAYDPRIYSSNSTLK